MLNIIFPSRHKVQRDNEVRTMSNNRLYIVNRETKEYLVIAKCLSKGWGLGNINELKKFLGNTFEQEETNLILGTGNDDKFYEEFIEKGKNINETKSWEYL